MLYFKNTVLHTTGKISLHYRADGAFSTFTASMDMLLEPFLKVFSSTHFKFSTKKQLNMLKQQVDCTLNYCENSKKERKMN